MKREFAPREDIVPGTSLALWRLLALTVVVSVPFVFGVCWVRQLPAGPVARAPDPFVEVEIVRWSDAMPSRSVAALQTSPPVEPRRQDPVAAPQPAAADDLVASPPPPSPPPSAPQLDLGATQPPSAMRSAPSRIVISFQKALMSHFERFPRYPEAARRQRLQGQVRLLFAMRRDGSVLDVRVKASSGAAVLDEEAVATVRRAQPLPPIPAELPDRLTILVPISFVLP